MCRMQYSLKILLGLCSAREWFTSLCVNRASVVRGFNTADLFLLLAAHVPHQLTWCGLPAASSWAWRRHRQMTTGTRNRFPGSCRVLSVLGSFSLCWGRWRLGCHRPDMLSNWEANMGKNNGREEPGLCGEGNLQQETASLGLGRRELWEPYGFRWCRSLLEKKDT